MNDPISGDSSTLEVYCWNGLCNRLMVLLSGKALAEASRRLFRMYWPATTHCAAGFSDLFENDWGVINAAPDAARASEILRWSKFMHQRIKRPDLLAWDGAIPLIQSYEWLVSPENYPAHGPLKKRCADLFEELIPIAPIRAAVDEFQARHFAPTTIGVHVRRGDHSQRVPDPSSIRTTCKAVDAYLKKAPGARIFLCTDDGAKHPNPMKRIKYQGIREQFEKRYPGKVITRPARSLDRGSVEAIQDALIELLLLRRVSYFVGTQGSTFSGMSIFGREISFVQCTDQSLADQFGQVLARFTGRFGFKKTPPKR